MRYSGAASSAAGAGKALVGGEAGHLKGHDPLRVAERAGVARLFVDPRELDADPVVVVVVLRPAGPRRWRGGAVEGRERARVGAFRRAGVVGVEVVAQADQPGVQLGGEGDWQAGK